MRILIVWAFLLAATTCEANGDALVRLGLFERTGLARLALLAAGAVLLFAYGVLLNLSPLPFERVVGLYVATLFLVWQVVSFITFRAMPGLPVLVGGALILAGGLLVSFWTPASA